MYEVVRSFQCENSSFLGDFEEDRTIKIITAVASSLSLVGAVLIIILHLIIVEAKTTSRLMLAHLSFANFFATSWHWIGVWFDYRHYPGHSYKFCEFCVAQALLSNIGLNVSTFWTVCIVVHYYLLLAYHKGYACRLAFYGYLATSWIIAVLLSSWLLFDHWLGYRSNSSLSYCSIRLNNVRSSSRNGLGVVLGSDSWLVLSFVAIVLFYLGVKFEMFRKTFRRVVVAEDDDFRFLYVPLVFPLLRVWGVLMDLLLINNSTVTFAIKVLAVAGDNSQGFVNFVLYCLFAKELHHVIRTICCKRRYTISNNSSIPSPTNNTLEESSFMDDTAPNSTGNNDTISLLSGIKV